MAATIGYIVGFSKDGKRQASQASRLGHGAVMANANTWRTFSTAHVNADGSGYVTVARDGKTIHHFTFESEGEVKRA
jgi:hypothetical protein